MLGQTPFWSRLGLDRSNCIYVIKLSIIKKLIAIVVEIILTYRP